MRSLKQLLFGKTFDQQISFVGLANAGKTTLVKRLKDDGELETVYHPTMGLSMETFKIGGVEVVAADLGGQRSFQESFWKPFVSKSAAVVFVFDSADTAKVEEAGEALDRVLSWVQENATFLFLANKIDKDEALSLEEVIIRLGLRKRIKERPRAFGVYQISALKDMGSLDEPIKWLIEQLSKYDQKPEEESQ